MIQNKALTGVLSGFVAGLLLHCASAHADVRLPNLFSDHMVLQEGMPVTVWGWADDGEEVTVTFRKEKVHTVAKDGKWMVRLKKLKAGGPDTLTVNGKNSITINDVLVGEVWVASGQSNMEWPLKASFESGPDIAASANPRIRLFHVPKLKSDKPVDDVNTKWTECNPETVQNISAVAYYFGRDLQKARNVPVGIIESDWGGSPAEAWTRQEVLQANPRYHKEILDSYDAAKANYDKAQAEFEKERDEAKQSGAEFKKKAPNKPTWKPSELYNGMIAPLVHYAIKGAIWYQGESNAGKAEQYRKLFPDMITNWRNDWGEREFTFLFVQLAPFMAVKEQPSDSAWAELREAQLLTTKVLPKAGMAVITDVGDPKDIHPKKKQPVGGRLAIAARGIAYGEHIEYSGPIYKSMKVDGNKVVLTFDHVGGGLEAKDGPLKGFAICGEDKKFVWADATIEKNHVVVSASDVQHPVAVRFGWADCPVVNLWNKEGLPASPFRTDDFPMVTAGK